MYDPTGPANYSYMWMDRTASNPLFMKFADLPKGTIFYLTSPHWIFTKVSNCYYIAHELGSPFQEFKRYKADPNRIVRVYRLGDR